MRRSRRTLPDLSKTRWISCSSATNCRKPSQSSRHLASPLDTATASSSSALPHASRRPEAKMDMRHANLMLRIVVSRVIPRSPPEPEHNASGDAAAARGLAEELPPEIIDLERPYRPAPVDPDIDATSGAQS